PEDMFKAAEGRWGSREAEITAVTLAGRSGNASNVFPSADPMEIRLQLRANTPVQEIVVGVGIFNAEGVCCYGTNTQIEGATASELAGEGEVRFAIDQLDLVAGTYKLDVA